MPMMVRFCRSSSIAWPTAGYWHVVMGQQLLALRRYDAAVQDGLKSIDLGRIGLRRPCGVLRGGRLSAGGEGRPGGGDETESQTLRGVASRAPTRFYRHITRFREALIKAGLPEE